MKNETFSLLIFHGSARPEAYNEAVRFAEKLKNQAGTAAFSICFLKGAQPEVDNAISQAIRDGWTKIQLIPLFLLPGSHTLVDIPEIVNAFKRQFPTIEFNVRDCLVNLPEFVQMVETQLRSH